MPHSSRRDFLKGALGAGVLASTGTLTLSAAAAGKKSATDWVTLGNSGVKVTRLAFGTGTYSGRVQRELGQEGFNKLVAYAYERGVRFFETADAYSGMPQMLATALKGVPRDTYRLMTKYRLSGTDDPAATIDRLRADLNSDYVDVLLMHCIRIPNWTDQYKRIQDGFNEAKEKKIILAHGASCHGLEPLRTFPGSNWLDVALMRMNHDGTKMDTMSRRDTDDKGDVKEVFGHVAEIKKQGTGVIGMKLIGEGRFTTPEQREAAMTKVLKSGYVDAITIGHKSPAEIDDNIERMNRILNS